MLRGEKRPLPLDASSGATPAAAAAPPPSGAPGSATTSAAAAAAAAAAANGSPSTSVAVPGTGSAVGTAGGGGHTGHAGHAGHGHHPHKKAMKEKMPDFDWSADNYALTWRLVDELRKPENKNVLFPDHDNLTVKSGDTKEDVYRRIAKVVHPEAYAQDAQIAGSRMKNKTVAMWKEYSGYCRRLQELCTAHQVVIPASGADETFPQEIQGEWRKIIISMPVFHVLRSFMPVRPEEKPKAPTVKVQRGVSSFPQQVSSSLEDEHIQNSAVDPHHLLQQHPHGHQHQHHQQQQQQQQQLQRDGPGMNSATTNSYSGSGPVRSPSMKRAASVSRDMALGTAEGQNVAINGHGHAHDHHTRVSSQSSKLSLSDYLELRRSYHEDVRLGIFTPAEAKIRIELLDKQRSQSQAENFRLMPPPPVPITPSPSSSGGGTFMQAQAQSQQAPLTPHSATRVMPPDPMQEHAYEEKALLLGFRRPLPPHPLSRLSYKEMFRAILDHAAECELQECRLDSLRKTPQLSFTFLQASTHPHEMGGVGMPVDVVFMTRSGLVPLIHHPLAASVRFLSRNTIHVMDVPLVIHNGNGWETTIWDFANAVVAAALRRRLSIDEVKTVQANAHIVSADPAFRQQFQLLNESSTFFDVLRTGLLSPNNWVPMSQYDDTLDHPVPQH